MQAAYSSVQVRSLENIHMSSGHANQTELVYYMTFVDENNSFEEGSFTFFWGKIVVVTSLNFRYYKLKEIGAFFVFWHLCLTVYRWASEFVSKLLDQAVVSLF